MVNLGFSFADYYIFILMPSIRGINIISIERLLHFLLSGKLFRFRSTSFFKHLSQSWFIIHKICVKRSTTFRSRRFEWRIQTWSFAHS